MPAQQLRAAEGLGESGEVLIERLALLIPALRQRASAADEAGRIPDETIRDLEQTGIFRAVVPVRFGGHEVDFRHVPQVFRTLGRGCVSTAWTMGFLVYHNFQFAHFPEAAQREVWGSGRGFTMAPGQVMPAGSAQKVEGGYLLKGRWGYATGIFHGDWMLLSAPVSGMGEKPVVMRFYVPVKSFRILDTWHVAAMRATGSNDVELDGEFVPDHRAVAVADLRGGTAEGLKGNSGPLYRIPLLTFMSLGAVGPLVGAAEAMFEIVAETMRTKVRAYSLTQTQQQMSTRVRLAELKCELDAMLVYYEAKIASVEGKAAAGVAMTLEERAEIRAAVSWVAKSSQRIVNALAREAGSRSNYLDSPVQRFQRDVNALATHALFDMDMNSDIYGSALLGGEISPQAMI
jgi:alkylation response protein AidB-like acyl-CoA dehydrogenase